MLTNPDRPGMADQFMEHLRVGPVGGVVVEREDSGCIRQVCPQPAKNVVDFSTLIVYN